MSESDADTSKPVDLGVFRKPEGGVMASDLIAIALSLLWLVGVVVYFFVLSPDVSGQPGLPVVIFAIFAPIILIWMAATVVKTARLMREEAARLQDAIDAMRQAYLTQAQNAATGVRPDVEKKLEEIAASQKQTANAIATFATSREVRLPQAAPETPALIKEGVPPGESQPVLALGTPLEATLPPISVNDFIGALNFPEDENDTEGFRQLRAALADPLSGRLIRASQDVLTLLAHDGIYMDDLTPDRAKPEIWRRFADGDRGRSVATLGGVHDRSSLALTSGRMRSDAVFRDAAHHFMRQFDTTFANFAKVASDEDITNLANTRTSRAFMLLGRVMGTFD